MSIFWTIVLLFFWTGIIIAVAALVWLALEKLNA
jgi:hypothetical protein